MMRRHWKPFLLLLIAFSCNKSDPAPIAPYPDGFTSHQLKVNGVTRNYKVHQPTALTKPAALIFVLHGGGGLGLQVAEFGVHPLSVFRTLADREGFVVVYPEGSADIQGGLGWNDCRTDDTSGSQSDDATFLAQLVNKVSSEYKFPSSQVFLSGTSNGALMSLSYAFQFTETIRAMAISAGNLPAKPAAGSCTNGPIAALPLMIAYGTSDPAMPVNGGCVANLGGACNRGTVKSQAETITYWLSKNELSNVTPTVSVFDFNTIDAGNVEKKFYAGPNPLSLFLMNNAGHSVPSKTVFADPSPASGVQNRDIEFAEEAWLFFKSFL